MPIKSLKQKLKPNEILEFGKTYSS